MRTLPRIRRPTLKPLYRKLRRVGRHLSVERVVVLTEFGVFVLLLFFVMTGRRAAYVDALGYRADLIASLLLLGMLALIHSMCRRYIIRPLNDWLLPHAYDERRILLDLGQEARGASSIHQLFEFIATRMATLLEAENVSIFVAEEQSADYLCWASYFLDNRDSKKGGLDNNGASDLRLRLSRDAVTVKRLQNLSYPLVIEPNQFEVWIKALVFAPPALREARERERDTLERIKSHLLVQVRTKDNLVGIVSLGSRRARFTYSAADREVLMSVAAQLALIIENSRLTERIVAQELLRRELVLATEVQQRLLPRAAPVGVSVDLAGFCEPASGVGGDYYDFISVDKQQVGLAIADVAGKGMPAALMMSTVQATLRSLTAQSDSATPRDSLAKMVTRLNHLLFNSTGGHNYVTFFYANFDETNQQLTYVNAGHNPPLHLRCNGSTRFTELTLGGLIAGCFEHSKYDQGTIQMEPNDLLFMYTDGLTEARNREGEEFGEFRVKETLAATSALSVTQIRDQILRRVKDWCLNVPLHDDLTFVVMKVK